MISHSLSSLHSKVCQLGSPRPARTDRAFLEWKRLLLADGPRQTINALTLYSFYLAKSSDGGAWWQISKYITWDSADMVTDILLVSMAFTVLIFIGSLLLLIVAAILYVPLLCYIRGNLKEYCCHKVDKVCLFELLFLAFSLIILTAYYRNHQAKAEAASCSPSSIGEEGSGWRLFPSWRKCSTSTHTAYNFFGRRGIRFEDRVQWQQPLCSLCTDGQRQLLARWQRS